MRRRLSQDTEWALKQPAISMVLSVNFAAPASDLTHIIYQNSSSQGGEAEQIPLATAGHTTGSLAADAEDEREAPPDDGNPAPEVDTSFDSPQDIPNDVEAPLKPLLYVALLKRKSETPEKLQGLLSQIRADHGSLPCCLVMLRLACSVPCWSRRLLSTRTASVP